MSKFIEVKVPDIGDYKEIPVIEIHVRVGDLVEKEQSIITLESDKATMDIPSSVSGVVQELKLKIGDLVSQGSLVLVLEPGSSDRVPAQSVVSQSPPATVVAPVAPSAPAVVLPALVSSNASNSSSAAPIPALQSNALTSSAHEITPIGSSSASLSHASPSVRKYARELGASINKVQGTGPKGRITQEDVQSYIKQILTSPNQASSSPVTSVAGIGLNLLPWPKIDFNKFGATQTRPLSRIQKISAANLARNWAMIPAVTYHEDADITLLEEFRVQTNKANDKLGIKVTLLAFLLKASVSALKKFPEFNSSLDGDQLILKQYFHLGFAADTPNGLVVPVIRDVDQKGILEIARETSELAKLARDGKLKPDQMQGACFTISSVGGLGSTYFAPIINAPEVAILGVSKAAMKPVWDGTNFIPRLICPLSLTADHRVIDGAYATRFNAYIAELLTDFRRVVL